MYEGKAYEPEHIILSVYSPANLQRPTFEEATSHEFHETHVGRSFGPSWSTHWIKVQLRVPAKLQKKDHLEFHWDANNEGLIWSESGEPLQGLTGGGERIEWVIPKDWRDGATHIFYVEMACNGMFGNSTGDSIQPPDPNRFFTLFKCELVAVNEQARQLYIDFWILGDAAREFPENSWEEHRALQLGNEIMNKFIANDGSQDSIVACRNIAARYFGDVNSASVYESAKDAMITAIGHCHIDTCWLWPWLACESIQ